MDFHFCAIQSWKLISFGQFSLPALCALHRQRKWAKVPSVIQSRHAHVFSHQHLPVIDFGLLITIAYVDPAYCRCRPNNFVRVIRQSPHLFGHAKTTIIVADISFRFKVCYHLQSQRPRFYCKGIHLSYRIFMGNRKRGTTRKQRI